MPQPTVIPFRAVLGLKKMKDGDVLPVLKRFLNGLRENSDIFKNPSVNLEKYSAAIDDGYTGWSDSVMLMCT
jgi:hypothetical protein